MVRAKDAGLKTQSIYCRGFIGIMEKKMETTGIIRDPYKGYIGVHRGDLYGCRQ